MITICTWLWGQKYGAHYVDKLQAGVARNLKMPHRFVCVTDRTDVSCETIPLPDPELTKVRDGCWARLRMFDPGWQAEHGIERLVCLDLDLVVTGSLDALFSRLETFVILRGGHWNPCPFNGSVMMLDRGARPEIWSRFNVKEAEEVAVADGVWRGSDQTWIAHVAPDAASWNAGKLSGIWSFAKKDWPADNSLPNGAKIVAFPGKRDPSDFPHIKWVRDNWRA